MSYFYLSSNVSISYSLHLLLLNFSKSSAHASARRIDDV